MAGIARSGFVWHELMTTDVEAAREFYREVTGLTTDVGDYPMLMDGGQPVGGLVGPTGQGPVWPSGGPEAHWIAYIGVEDVDAAVQRAQSLGGEILLPPVDVPGFGRAAVLRDPQGAAFGLFTVQPG
ncbi:MAG: VOC family protein [Anaerolineae bacterium]|jgi:predicted enzyme related to lactoylglutathione lyase